jgi:hypothetical protein
MLTKQTDMIPLTNLHTAQADSKAVKILAKSIFKDMKAQGYESKQVVSLATELIALVTSELQSRE